MPDNQWDAMLAAAASEVLETMFFTEVYGPALVAEPEAEPRLAVRLSFAGSPSGALTLSASAAAAQALAANFLAPEQDGALPAAQLAAVVSELANMICGSLLSRVATEAHFRLSSPEVAPADAVCPPGAPSQSLDLGEGAIDLWLDLEPHAV